MCVLNSVFKFHCSLAGNRDRSKRSVFVVGVDPDGAAAQDRRLQIADEILSVSCRKQILLLYEPVFEFSFGQAVEF